MSSFHINHTYWCGNKTVDQCAARMLETGEHKHFEGQQSVLIYMWMANEGNTSEILC